MVPSDDDVVRAPGVAETQAVADAETRARIVAAEEREYGAAVCVEGVETARELALLDAMEPDFYQGWYFSRPVRISVAKRFSLEQTCVNSQ